MEELKAMPLEEFMKLIPSNRRRTLKRMSTKVKHFIEKFRKLAGRTDKVMKTHVREMVVLPEMIGSRIRIYNGKEFVDVMITAEMLGKRLGEFAHTIKMVKHSGPGIGATRGSKAVELK